MHENAMNRKKLKYFYFQGVKNCMFSWFSFACKLFGKFVKFKQFNNFVEEHS